MGLQFAKRLCQLFLEKKQVMDLLFNHAHYQMVISGGLRCDDVSPAADINSTPSYEWDRSISKQFSATSFNIREIL